MFELHRFVSWRHFCWDRDNNTVRTKKRNYYIKNCSNATINMHISNANNNKTSHTTMTPQLILIRFIMRAINIKLQSTPITSTVKRIGVNDKPRRYLCAVNRFSLLLQNLIGFFDLLCGPSCGTHGTLSVCVSVRPSVCLQCFVSRVCFLTRARKNVH